MMESVSLLEARKIKSQVWITIDQLALLEGTRTRAKKIASEIRKAYPDKKLRNCVYGKDYKKYCEAKRNQQKIG